MLKFCLLYAACQVRAGPHIVSKATDCGCCARDRPLGPLGLARPELWGAHNCQLQRWQESEHQQQLPEIERAPGSHRGPSQDPLPSRTQWLPPHRPCKGKAFRQGIQTMLGSFQNVGYLGFSLEIAASCGDFIVFKGARFPDVAY